MNPEAMTSRSPTLDRRELASTAVATAASASLYARQGSPYLARGVVGDLLGFVTLAVPLAVRRRFRHEGLVCLGAIAVVLARRPRWPLERSSGFWWASFAAGLAGYLGLRGARLRPAPEAASVPPASARVTMNFNATSKETV